MKKTVAMLAVVVMLLSLMPLSAFASTQESYGEDYGISYDPVLNKARGVSENIRTYDAVNTIDDLTNLPAFRNTLLNAFYNCESVNISSYRIPYTAANVEALRVYIYDCLPGIFHFNNYQYWWNNGYISIISPEYLYTASEHTRMFNQIKATKDRLLQGIQGNSRLSEAQKALLIHDRLAMFCEYDYSFDTHCYDVYGALVLGDCVCQGYAEAYDYLLEQAGLESYVNISNDLDHAWNIVFIDGRPYHVDVTWDDYSWDDGERGVVGAVGHENFLRSSNGIYATGHWAYDYESFPSDTRYDNYFWQNSITAFQLVNNEIYYIDNNSQSLKRYSDHQTLRDLSDSWGVDEDHWSCLASDGNQLYYSLSNEIYQYNIPMGTATKLYKPSLSSGDRIYGFQYEDGYIVCDINNVQPEEGELYRLYQVRERTYAVSYNANGGSGAPSAQLKAPGTPLVLSMAEPTRSGYAFVGWSTSPSATTAAYQPGGQFKNNTKTTLYAVWQKGAYRVSFNANGGSGAPDAQIKVPGTPLTLSTVIPKRSGYAFVGWSTSPSATTASYQPGGQFKNNAKTTLYAVWQQGVHRVTYNANGGSGAPNSQIKVPGTPLTLSSTVPKRDGYAFVGWATSPSATTASYQPGGQFKNNVDTTFYAVWQKGAYRVAFNANGGSGVPNAQIKVPGTPLTLASTFPKRSGYGFLGWATNASATTPTYQPGSQFKNNCNTTLYAVWKKGVYRVSYDANGGKGAPEGQIKVPGTPLTLSTKRPTRTGYKFLGWATDKNAKAGTYASGAQFKNNSNTTLYAVWKRSTPTLTVGSTHTANVTTGGQEVRFTFKPTASGAYRIYSTGSDDTKVYLYDASGNQLSSDDDGGDGLNFSLEYELTAGVTYQYGVRYYNSSKTGAISFRFEKVGLTPGQSYTANITTGDDRAEYTFIPSTSGTYRIYSTGSGDAQVYLLDAAGNQLAYDDDSGDALNFSLDYTMTAGVTYKYAIRFYGSSTTGSIPFHLQKI